MTADAARTSAGTGDAHRTAVVTGIGVVAPGGIGVPAFWDLLTAGRSATGPITLFDPQGFRSRIAAECEFDPVAAGLSPEQARRLDRTTQFALVAAAEAMRDSGLDFAATDPYRLGTVIGGAVGCTIRLEEQYKAVSNHGRDWLVDHTAAGADLYDYLVPSSIAAEVAWQCGAQGPVSLISTGCTSGLDAVGHAAALIVEGSADVVVAGASDAPISPITVACFDTIRATSANNADPGHASRPFDRRRDGFVLGEGAAVFVIEEAGHARRRGAAGYCRVAGFARRANAYHMTGLRPDGREMADAIRVALAGARLDPTDIDYVNAHGSGTRQNDVHETAAFKHSLGQRAYQVPVSSIKSMVGHSLGAIGSIEVAACALALRHQVVPPTANLTEPDPDCDLDYVPVTARDAHLDAVLSVGSGFGGFQTAVVLDRTAAHR
ncbi:beta-ketoacyl-[acyl-carrier-protein] synthase family protein [Solwaraspora sp. WMMA2056]|uniref:beta-ketoacyl-[acyl-carrier-protein] synthase family protein n=1 Tax=Solwaraspora sp. WMMA2056 TaxID=3015161 RepID=UPI00259B1613|nr:beta-ketoacyl-[acyl-carrier-protein] synthase family protein [Solwaraspora sp. WMMA2056]WJK38227.1 beta-ketoacyl-[acyl-carrier-protein] synthase family protein [Solwaraspora sp. WMMA2056]